MRIDSQGWYPRCSGSVPCALSAANSVAPPMNAAYLRYIPQDPSGSSYTYSPQNCSARGCLNYTLYVCLEYAGALGPNIINDASCPSGHMYQVADPSQVVISPPPSPNISPTPTASPLPFNDNFAIVAQVYSDPTIKSLIRSGDVVLAVASRSQGNAETPLQTTDQTFTRAIAQLNAINKSEKGVVKMLMLSAMGDLDTLITNNPSFPKDIDIISYNQEPGITPAAEIGTSPYSTDLMQSSAIEFANKIHNLGMQMNYGPTYGFFDRLESENKLSAILQVADGVAYQGQNVLPTMTEDAFSTLICNDKYSYVKNTRSSVQFNLQLWNPQQTTDQMIKIFNRLQDCLNLAGIGSQGNTLGDTTRTVMQGLSR